MQEFQRSLLDACVEYVETHGGELDSYYKRNRFDGPIRGTTLIIRYKIERVSYTVSIDSENNRVAFNRFFGAAKKDFEKFLEGRFGDKVSFAR